MSQKLELTAEQVSWLRAHAAEYSEKEIAARLGLCLRTSRKRVHELGLTWQKQRKWDPAMDDTLRALAGKATIGAIATTMKVSRDSVKNRAKRIGVSLAFDRCAARNQQVREMVAAGMSRAQIAAAIGMSRQNTWHLTRKLGLNPIDGRFRPATWIRLQPASLLQSLRLKSNPAPRKPAQKPPAAPHAVSKAASLSKPPKQAPRERVGLPVAIRRAVITGTVSYCDRCSSPVVDTPTHWHEHNLRVHAQPLRRIA